MIETSVSQGIKARLKNSALTFEEKLKLCRRILKCSALKVHHGVVLHWVFQTLERKKIASKDKNEKNRRSLWSLLDCVSNLEEDLRRMGGISAETFINIITPTEDEGIQDQMWGFASLCLNSEYLLLILSKSPVIVAKLVTVLVDQFAERLTQRKDLNTLLKKLPHERENGDGDIDGMIISLAQGLEPSRELKTFLSRTFFPQKCLDDWSLFLSLLYEVKDEKPPVSVYKSLEILKDPRIQPEVFLPRIYSSVNAKMSCEDTAKLFIFFSYLLGFSQLDLINGESMWIISSNKSTKPCKSSKKKAVFLQGMLLGLLSQEDKGWKSLVSGEVSFQKWVTHLAKDLILDVEAYGSVLIQLTKLNPIIIEPLIGRFSCSLLFDRSRDLSQEISGLIDTYAKLRLIPKLIAKTLIYLSAHPEISINSDFSLGDDARNKLAHEFEVLIFGQCLELWKTLDYHLNESKDNTLIFVDEIMDLFLSNCRLVDFSIPGNVIEKVKDMVKKTSGHMDRLKVSRKTLIDFSLLLKHVRQGEDREFPCLDNESHLNVVQRMKLKEVNGESKYLTSLDSSGIRTEDASLFTSHLDSKGLHLLAEKCLAEGESSHHVIQEDRKLQESIVELLENNIIKSLSLKDNSIRVDELKDILQDKKSYSKSKYISSVTSQLHSYLQLPLEHIDNELSDRIFIFCLSLLLITEDLYSDTLFQILSRVLFAKKILKSIKALDISLLLTKLTPRSRESQWKRTTLEFLAGHSVRNFTNLCNMETYLKAFGEFFNGNVNELETVTLLFTALGRSLILNSEAKGSSNDKTPELSNKLFNSLAKCHLERVSNLGPEDEEVILLLLEGSSIFFEANKSDKSALSPWKNNVEKLFFFCTDEDNTEDSGEIATKFLTNLCTNYKIFKKSIDVNLIWSKLKGKREFSSPKEALIQALFQIPKEEIVQGLLSDILIMSKENKSTEDFCASIGLWKLLVKSKDVPPEINSIRQEYIKTLLNFYHALIIGDKLSNEAILKVLDLEKAIFLSEKVVVKADSEASCLITPLRVKFSTPQENDLFFPMWHAVCELAYLALQRRERLILPRIPILCDILRNLSNSLMLSASSGCNHEELSLCTRRLERLLETLSRHREDITRVAPYIIADILHGFQSHKMHSEIKSNLIGGLHWLFKLGDKHSTAFLASSLPLGLTEMFKDLYDDYVKNFKYAGRI